MELTDLLATMPFSQGLGMTFLSAKHLTVGHGRRHGPLVPSPVSQTVPAHRDRPRPQRPSGSWLPLNTRVPLTTWRSVSAGTWLRA